MWSIVLVVAVLIGVSTIVIYMDKSGHDDAPQAADHQENMENEATEKSATKYETNHAANPFPQTDKQAELTDTHFQNYLHKMSHQKVEAEDKWGFYEITDERIAWLLGALEVDDVQRRLTDGDVYTEILSRWQDGDFSQVDKDHNKIWRLQGGTIGKATGILDEDEEATYIENTPESE